MSYGRNFGFRVPPAASARQGRHATKLDDDPIPIGAPIAVDASEDPTALGLQPVALAADGLARGAGGQKGVCVFEYGPDAFRGDDPALTNYSDKDTVPPGKAVQMIGGDPAVKVWFRNTVDRTRLNTRAYTGRVMVAGLTATPSIVVGDFLVPGVGNDDDGYWKETATEANAWFQVTFIDPLRLYLEAKMLF